jgi:hypothetical protein
LEMGAPLVSKCAARVKGGRGQNIDGMMEIRSKFRNQGVLHVVCDILLLDPCLGDQLQSA